jgi:ferrous-iron efflux pump FieF
MSRFENDKIKTELLAVCVSLGLALLKGATAFWTGALTLFASALDSLLDFLVSSLNLFALVVSQKGPDEDHMFGHEKAEALGGLFQSLMIIASAAYLIYSSYERLHHSFQLQHLNEGMGVILISMVASFYLTYRLRKTSRDTGSMVLKADAIHYSVDLYAYIVLLVTFALIQLSGWLWWDPVVTLPLSLYIAYQGFGVGKEAVDELMDRETSPEALITVKNVVAQHAPEVVGMHNFKSRRAGGKRYMQFHVEMKRNLSFHKVHEITELLVKEIRNLLGNVHVIIHPDPEGHGEDESDLM